MIRVCLSAAVWVLMMSVGFGEELFTKIVDVRPNFYDDLAGDSDVDADPFSEEDLQAKSWRVSLRELLTAEGVTFPEGSMTSRGVSGQLVLRNTKANLELIEKIIAKRVQSDQPVENDPGSAVAVHVELIKLPHSRMADLLHRSGDDARFFEQLDAYLKAGEVELSDAELMDELFSLPVDAKGIVVALSGVVEQINSALVRTRSGTKGEAHSTTEHEYSLKWSFGRGNVGVPVVPVKFATEVNGLVVAATPTVGEGKIGLEISVEVGALLGKQSFGEGNSEIELPLFYWQSLSTRIDLVPGRRRVLGSFTPNEGASRILVIAKATAEGIEGKEAKVESEGCLVEVFEVEAGVASGIVESADARKEMLRVIGEGKGRRIESVYLASAKRAVAKVFSGAVLRFPIEREYAKIPEIKKGQVVDDKTEHIKPVAPTKFQTEKVGSGLVFDNGNGIVPTLSSFHGFESHGRDEARIDTPIIMRTKVPAIERQKTGTELLTMQVPSDPETGKLRSDKRVFVFVTRW